jgi:Ca2+-binding EF-hand superfamily protein
MPTQTKIRRLFTEFDTDGSGFVELDELHSALLKGGKKSTRQDTIALLAEVDLNHDAKISLDEVSIRVRTCDSCLEFGTASP